MECIVRDDAALTWSMHSRQSVNHPRLTPVVSGRGQFWVQTLLRSVLLFLGICGLVGWKFESYPGREE